MTYIEKAQLIDYGPEQDLWNVHGKVLREHGIDLGKALAEWAAKQAKQLTTMEGCAAFGRLCEHGCVPQVLAVILALVRNAPRFKTLWEEILGDRQKRHKAARSLEKATRMLEEVFGKFITTEKKNTQSTFAQLGRLLPSRLISELRFYVQFLNFTESIAKEAEVRSLEEISRYLLASYVKRTTGKFHDSDTSALLAEIVGPFYFNEVAQRMWRLRNYERLDRNFSKITDFSVAMGVVIARST